MSRQDSAGMPPELAELLGAIGRQKEEESDLPIDRAVEMLRNSMLALDEKHEFERGQIVRPKRGVEDGIKPPRGGIAMFDRYMDDAEKEFQRAVVMDGDGSDAYAFVVASRDCFCLTLMPDGGALIIPYNSRMLEPHPDYR